MRLASHDRSRRRRHLTRRSILPLELSAGWTSARFAIHRAGAGQQSRHPFASDRRFNRQFPATARGGKDWSN